MVENDDNAWGKLEEYSEAGKVLHAAVTKAIANGWDVFGQKNRSRQSVIERYEKYRDKKYDESYSDEVEFTWWVGDGYEDDDPDDQSEDTTPYLGTEFIIGKTVHDKEKRCPHCNKVLVQANVTDLVAAVSNFRIRRVIFDHDFAKSLWPNSMKYPYEKGSWQYNLQAMTLADDPVEYLKENM